MFYFGYMKNVSIINKEKKIFILTICVILNISSHFYQIFIHIINVHYTNMDFFFLMAGRIVAALLCTQARRQDFVWGLAISILSRAKHAKIFPAPQFLALQPKLTNRWGAIFEAIKITYNKDNIYNKDN